MYILCLFLQEICERVPDSNSVWILLCIYCVCFLQEICERVPDSNSVWILLCIYCVCFYRRSVNVFLILTQFGFCCVYTVFVFTGDL